MANYAYKERLVKNPIRFSAFLPHIPPPPKALALEESWRIGQTARAATGFVGEEKRDGYAIPAGVWWYAWYLTMSRVGNRLTAMMLAERGDYRHGVLWLKADNQKQARDQRLELRTMLLAGHPGPWSALPDPALPLAIRQAEAGSASELEHALRSLP